MGAILGGNLRSWHAIPSGNPGRQSWEATWKVIWGTILVGNPGRHSCEAIREAMQGAIWEAIWEALRGTGCWRKTFGNPRFHRRRPQTTGWNQSWESILEAIWEAILEGNLGDDDPGCNPGRQSWADSRKATLEATRNAIWKAILGGNIGRAILGGDTGRQFWKAMLGGNAGRQSWEAMRGDNSGRQFGKQCGRQSGVQFGRQFGMRSRAAAVGGRLLLILYQDPLGPLKLTSFGAPRSAKTPKSSRCFRNKWHANTRASDSNRHVDAHTKLRRGIDTCAALQCVVHHSQRHALCSTSQTARQWEHVCGRLHCKPRHHCDTAIPTFSKATAFACANEISGL